MMPIDGGTDPLGGEFDYVSYEFVPSTVGLIYTGGTGANGIAVDDAVIVGDAGDVLIGTDTITGVEGFAGTLFRDVFNGGSGDETLNGLAGDDDLFGGDGNDFFTAGSGNDMIDGGLGYDTLSYFFMETTGGITYNGGTGTDIGNGLVTGDVSIGSDTLTDKTRPFKARMSSIHSSAATPMRSCRDLAAMIRSTEEQEMTFSKAAQALTL